MKNAMPKLGLVVNPRAGRGTETNARVARQLIETLKPETTFVGAGEMGADALAGLNIEPLDYAPAQGRARTPALVTKMIGRGVEMIAVVGGDGTMADVAFALFRAASRVPMLGIGVGSTNVGGLVTLRGDAIARLADAQLEPHARNALIAGANGETLGIAFNDVVISTTVLATVDNQLAEVQVAPKIAGENVPGASETIFTDATRVWRESPNGTTEIARGNQIGTLLCGFPDSRFFGKAIAGQACLAAYLDLPAGCLVGSQPLVRMIANPQELMCDEPFLSRYASFDENSTIHATDLREGVALCADGNPLKILARADEVTVGVKRHCVTALRISKR
jgi:predicted polyphosphate/ATP-dependent NAD kinase